MLQYSVVKEHVSLWKQWEIKEFAYPDKVGNCFEYRSNRMFRYGLDSMCKNGVISIALDFLYFLMSLKKSDARIMPYGL